MTIDPAPEIPVFDRRFFDGQQRLTRIGSGDLGGKASGLFRVTREILSLIGPEDFPYFTIEVPTFTVLTTEVFDRFMDLNQLWTVVASEPSDDRIAHAFQKAQLPPEFAGDLRALIAQVRTPLAVRSSSRLEDALDHPFAGVYATKMIPNNEIEIDARFRRLSEAVKFVYASTFFAESRSYLRSIGRSMDAEAMAVIIQEVVGQRAGDRFYPCVSGVARSFNFYPSGSCRPDEGVVNLALGLGKTIVDGGLSWSYCPAWPKAPPPFNDVGDLLKYTQTSFWAVNMGPTPLPDPIRETECMIQLGLAHAEQDGALKLLASTYDAASDRMSSGLGPTGPRALTFAPLLGSRFIPFNDVVRRLLDLSRQALGEHVEIELALNLDRTDGLPARLGFLQVRPMAVGGEEVAVEPADLVAENAVVASDMVLGNGRREGLTDVVYLLPGAFDQTATREIARELESINQQLVEAGDRYVLIGFGRWGTSDPWLGVPVAWGQISGARVIVEATLPGVNPDLSQGSHFFHNVLGFQILYLSVRHDGPYAIDWQWLERQPVVHETRHVRHVRTSEALEVCVDGRSRRGVVRRHD